MAGSGDEKQIFISYGREPDVISFVGKLKLILEENGLTVWVDLKEIEAGSDWHGAIGAGLHKCQAIVPIITHKYLSSRYCINELYTADRDRRLIFPIIYQDVDFSVSDAAMGVKYIISGVNWTWCRPDRDDSETNLFRFIEGVKAKGVGTEEKPLLTVQSSHTTIPPPLVGPKNIKQPVLRIPDIEMTQGITTGPKGEIVCTSASNHEVVIYNKVGEKQCSFGGCGIDPSNMFNPSGVAINEEGNVLVACQYSLKKFSMDGKLLREYGGIMAPDSDPLKLQAPSGLVVGLNGRVYVSEIQTNKVKIFDSDLSFVAEFTDACPELGSGHLNHPQGVAVNSKGNIYVADMSNNVIQVFAADGKFLFKFGKMGVGPGCINTPSSIAVDGQDHVYIGSGTCTVSIFDEKGTFMRVFGSHGAELGKFNYPRGLHVGVDGKVYVGEWTTNRIQVFQ